jgi:hypothetical protein
MEPTQSPIQWRPGTLSLEIKQLGYEADHSLPSAAEARIRGGIPLLPHMPSWHVEGQLYFYTL